MSTLVATRPSLQGTGDGGGPARRAMARWAWRLFRREWRRQALVLSLLVLAVAATTVGLGVAANATELKADPTFGTANTLISLPGSDPQLSADVAAVQSAFGPVDVIEHQQVPVPGSVSTIDLRAQDPHGHFGRVTLRLDSGRYPTGAGEVAVTRGVAQDFGLHVGTAWQASGTSRQVVGLVEDPLNLLDQFALVGPGGMTSPDAVSVLVNAGPAMKGLQLPSGVGLRTLSRGAGGRVAAEAVVLVLGSVGLLFVGLMAVAGFTVMAHRRLRALGMVGSIGASDRHIRMVMLANGVAVGATAAVVGTAVGLAGWFAFVPTLQSISAHRVDPLALPWWGVGAAMLLTFITAVAAAWWPARALTRLSIVAALSGRPPRPQPAHRFASLGAVLLAGGLVLLAFADQRRAGFIIGGTVVTAVGVLFLAPLLIRVLARAGRRAGVSVRLALRDLVRFQARSGAALGAITLAIGVAATIAISAAAAETPVAKGNLPNDQLVLYVNPGGGHDADQVPPLTAAQLQTLTQRTNDLAGAIHAAWVLPLDVAYDPQSPIQPPQPGPGIAQAAGYPPLVLASVHTSGQGVEINFVTGLHVATPAVLAHYGIDPSRVDPRADILTSRHDLAGLQIFDPGDAGLAGPAPPTAPSNRRPVTPPELAHPTIQIFDQLPSYESEPGTLVTSHFMQTAGMQSLPAGFLVQTHGPLTADQLATARHAAASGGLYVETRKAQHGLAPLRNWATATGILVALGVLGMTVGLIRSESAGDLRTLAATGASSTTRRTLTATTSGALALLGAVLGTAGAYAALFAWHRSDLSPLGRVPALDLAAIVVGLPLLAAGGGWLFAGREPPTMARPALD